MPSPPPTLIVTEDLAGLRNQALGLAEAAGLSSRTELLSPRPPWRWIAAGLWPAPLAAVGLALPPESLVIGCGGVAAAVGAALRERGRRVVHIQHPRMDPRRFDLIVASRHDRLTGPNVLVSRTALHRVTPAGLAAAAATWAPRLADLPRPLVAVLLGGSNGRFRFDAAVAAALGAQLAEMMRRDGVGLALTPSRRTDPSAVQALQAALAGSGAWFWDGTGDNPYFGLLALADAIVVTEDSVSMLSEAVATSAPVMLARLPGRSRRIGQFTAELIADGRVRPFAGRWAPWQTAPLDDTAEVAAEVRRRLVL